ncbi:patatin-like phospholipase family protein [Bacteroidota bacterium]
MKIFKDYSTGIVLSGGAVRGFAHLGVLKALHEADMIPDVISGVSAGSIVGAFYADGYEPEEILEIFESKNFYKLIGILFRGSGLFDTRGLKKLLKNNLKARTFDQLKKPLFIAATNLISGRVEYFSQGSLIDKVLASSSIPVVFKPQKIKGIPYVDGGLINNLPLAPIKGKCKKVIGVNVTPLEENPKLKRISDVAIRSFHISIAKSAQENKEIFDIYIEPEELKDYGYINLKKGQELFDIGYKVAVKVLSS